MSFVVYLFPLLVIGGIAAYYVWIFQKGKAAGGGMMDGFAQRAREKWQGVLQPNENIQQWGSGVKWRPSWQALLAGQIPILRLIWPTVLYQMVITDQGRVLLAETNTLGFLKNPIAYPKQNIQLDNLVEEKPGLALKLNPLYNAFGQNQKTFDVGFRFPDRTIRMFGVPEAFVSAVAPR